MRRKFPLYLQTLLALVLGVAVGLYWGPRAGFLAGLAKVLIHLIKNAAVPLLFLAIFDAMMKAEFKGRSVAALFGISALNSLCAVTIGLTLINLFHPGRSLPLRTQHAEVPAAVSSVMRDFSAEKAVMLFIESPMILSILAALILGVGILILSRTGRAAAAVGAIRRASDQALTLWIRVMGWFLHLVPIAVFGSVAKVVGETGFSLMRGLTLYLVFCLAGMALQVALVYHSWLAFYARVSLRRFWREAREPVVHGFGINSSLATLPFTLKALDRLGVSPASARLSACVGTNFNNDGILLYEVVAALFIAQAYGIDLPIWQQVVASLVCVIATVGVGGIPEAGIISLAIVLSSLKLPLEGITILLTVDWLIARCRSATNVLGDMTVAIALDGPTPTRSAAGPPTTADATSPPRRQEYR